MKIVRNNIKWRILIPLASALGVLLAVSILTVHILHTRRINNQTQKRLNEVNKLFKMEQYEDTQLLKGLISLVQKDNDLREAWLTKDRKNLLKFSKSIFDNIRQQHKITHFYFHDLDRVCFLRVHNPSRHGDYIDRFTMNSAVRDEKVAYGIELGPLGTFTLRVVYPWQIDGKLVGYIELGEEIEHITADLKEALGVELCLFINKSYLNRAEWEDGMKMLGRQPQWNQFPNFVISSSTFAGLPQGLSKYLDKLSKCDNDEHLSNTLKMSLNKQHYLGRFMPLIDASGQDIGYFLVNAEITEEVSGLRVFSVILTLCCIIVIFSFLGFFYFYIGEIDNKLVNSYNNLQESKEKMLSVLETAPDYILNVDRDGKILFINRTVQGAAVKDVIGTNICGHMPPEYQDTITNTIEQVFQTGQIQSFETIVTPVGTNQKTWQVTRIGPVKHGQEIVAATIISTDITEHKITEEKLNNKMNELSQFNMLAVGRELQMIELKKEVDNLLRELNREEKYKDDIEYIENKSGVNKPKIS
ncbi:MAG: cache domain-containing protein [Sedimentisphaerales bacterium]|nr:cache domain-containing protein [Sedimentisphaerales bacterium]